MTKSKLLLFGFILILLIAIPITVYFVQKQQENRSQAIKSTTLSYTPATKTVQKGQQVSLDVFIDPGQNQVSFVKLDIGFDPAFLATASAGTACQKPFCVDSASSLTIAEGPVYTPGNIVLTMSAGADPTKVIQGAGPVKLGTITFDTLAATTSTPTRVSFGSTTEVISIAGGDQASENVLSTTSPSDITITDVTPTATPTLPPGVTPSVTPVPTITGAPTPTKTPTPTVGPSPTAGAPTATIAPTATVAPTATIAPTAVVAQPPTCTALNADRAPSGTAPFSITLTAIGNDTVSPISKVTFNFGDGPNEDVTTGNGIGTTSVSVPKAHTYNNAGSFTAFATFTNAAGATSIVGTCKQTVTVNAALANNGGGSGGGGGQASQPVVTQPVLAKPGPADTFVIVGALGAILSILGGMIFFIL